MTSAAAEQQRVTDDLFTDDEARNALVPEIVREIAERAATPAPSSIAVLSLRDIRAAGSARMAFQEASIKVTYPEDWVVFQAKDGARVGFLQDVGCARVRSLWGISFDKAEFLEEDLEDGNVHFICEVHGRCQVTGERAEEMGQRASNGFFERSWEDAKGKPVDRARIRFEIRKAALANARGRLIRTLTGLGSVPVADLVRCGLDEKRLRGVEMQSGTKGGSGSGASKPQLQAICGEALKQGKVAGLDQVLNWDRLFAKLEEAKLSGGRGGKASQLIERLKSAQKGAVTIAQFEEALGVALVDDSGASE